MAQFKNKKYKKGDSVVLDGNEYIDCEFNGCTMIYSGGDLPKFSGKTSPIAFPIWKFEGAALKTMDFLISLYTKDPNAVEGLFNQIRGNNPPPVWPKGFKLS